MTKFASILLSLLRQDASIRLEQVSAEEWQQVIDLAFNQGVDAIAVDGYTNRSLSTSPIRGGDGLTPSPSPLERGDLEGALDGTEIAIETEELENLKFEWFGSVLQAEEDYRKYETALANLADIFAKAGLVPLIFKGYALSQDYPVPQHRSLGDIDIFMGPEGDEAVRKAGIKVETEYHKHSHFTNNGITVENHHKFLDDVKHRSNARFERILQQILHDDKYPIEELTVKGRKVMTPNATFNALFLLRHTGEHFASHKITLRHVMDVGYYFSRHHKEIDIQKVLQVLRQEGMQKFYNAIGTVCIERLGMSPDSFPGLTIYSLLADKVLDDIFRLSAEEKVPSRKHIFRYGLFMTCRWWQNRWKYRLVYDESLLESFISLAVNRLREDKE